MSVILAVAEIDHLVDVFENATREDRLNQEPNIMYLGDFNAGCSYVAKSKWPTIRLRNQTRFNWYIGDSTFTNVALSCPYDRFVSTQGIRDVYINGSASIYRFDLVHNLTPVERAVVSDHFPIEMTLRIPVPSDFGSPITCFGKISQDPTVCSGNGTCIGLNQCECVLGRNGTECQTVFCLVGCLPPPSSPGNDLLWLLLLLGLIPLALGIIGGVIGVEYVLLRMKQTPNGPQSREMGNLGI